MRRRNKEENFLAHCLLRIRILQRQDLIGSSSLLWRPSRWSMPSILPRDLDLDLSLESEARTTIIIAGVAVGVLVLFAAVLFCRQNFRRSEGLTRTNSNTTGTTATDFTKSSPPAFRSIRTMLISHPFPVGSHPGAQGAQNDTRRQCTVSPMRKYTSIPRYTNISVYRGANGLHTPPPAKLASSRPPTMPSLSMQTFTHNAAWMELADNVVGRHPKAKPLNSRLATKAEIDMISGHVHIPWAYNISDRAQQPIPVKVLKPVVSLPVIPPTKPNLLRDVSNIPNRELRVVNGSRAIINLDTKARRVHRSRGKENMSATLAVPGSSVRIRN